MDGDWRGWRASTPTEFLRPTLEWEGTDVAIVASKVGAAANKEHALRDPFPFQGHLFYAAGGESAIGVVRLAGDQNVSGST